MLRKDHPWNKLTLEIDDNDKEKRERKDLNKERNLNIQTKKDLHGSESKSFFFLNICYEYINYNKDITYTDIYFHKFSSLNYIIFPCINNFHIY